MKKPLLFPIVIALFMLLPNLSFSQLYPPSLVDVTLEANVDSTFQVDPAMMDSSTLALVPHNLGVIVALADTQLVANVHVKLTNNGTGTVIFDGDIPFSQTSAQTTAYTLVREGKILYLDFGSHTGSVSFLAETYTKDSLGGISTTITN